MPAMYAHDTFGRKVAAKLPLSVKQPILQYPQMFRVGLQGPDVLFFYNPFTEHPIGNVEDPCIKNSAILFGKCSGNLESRWGKGFAAFLFDGLLCHFMLDSSLPSVYRQPD